MRMESPVGAKVIIDGREMDYFSGTGYLCLQNHPDVLQAAAETLARYGLTTATSRGSYGEHTVYDALEKEACAFLGVEKVFYFASGYMGAAVLTQGEGNRYEHIFIDSAAHFSLWDAAQATNKPITPFHHRRPEHLEERLRLDLHPSERPLVLSDGVFPISGEITPLPDYLRLVERYDGLVILDDAHAAGVLGQNGRGTADHFGMDDNLHYAASITLAKALGGYGGMIGGTLHQVENIERNSRICAGASPPPLPMAAASARALAIARMSPELREQLWANVARARAGLRTLGWDLEDSPVPILCLEARGDVNLLRLYKGLYKNGIAVSLIQGYTSTPPGGALRIAIFSGHTYKQIDRLIDILRQLL